MIRYCFVYNKTDHRRYQPVSNTRIARNTIIGRTEIILTSARVFAEQRHTCAIHRVRVYVTLSAYYI